MLWPVDRQDERYPFWIIIVPTNFNWEHFAFTIINNEKKREGEARAKII